MAAFPKYTYKHITSGTVIVKPSVGTLAAVCVNKALAGTVTITDGAATIAILTNGTTAPLGTVLFGGAGGVQFASLTVALSSTEDITVVFE
jgi:hypothetical protein